LPRLFGKGRFGLYATDPDLPRLFGKGRFGLNATDPDLPRLFGKGRFGLTFVADMPRLFGKGKLGLLLDTFALAMQGTTRTADKAATDSSFIKRASPGSLVHVAYRLRITNLSGGCLTPLQLWWNLMPRRLVILPMYLI
jgi:hypothetical protein